MMATLCCLNSMFRALIALTFFVLLSSDVIAQSIPIDGMAIKITPASKKADESISEKSIHVNKTKSGIKVFWYSIVRNRDETKYFPTFVVKASKGIVEIDSLDFKRTFFQPSLWGNGYIRSGTSLPLWVDPKILELKGRQKGKLNIGLLNMSQNIMQLVPEPLFEQVSFFQNLYDQYIKDGEVRESLGLRKSQQRELKSFIKEFNFVRRIAKTKAKITVNEAKEDYPSLIIGNDYYQVVVLDDPLNPLVVSFKIFDDKYPKVFRNTFKSLKENLEFKVSKIDY